MLSNCDEKMILISTTTNEWPQNQMLDEKSLNMVSTATRLMEKPTSQEQQQQQQQPLKCPRCDSSNTKFCYYNNYSLSQPRHFCKACKRYWTRGGTLRNVPVGGGCRKNKRVKRPSNNNSSSIDAANSSSSTCSANNLINSTLSQPQIDIISSSSSNHSNPLFYGLPTNIPNDVNLASFSRFNSRGVSSGGNSTACGYNDLQPQLNALGLGFSSNDFGNPTKQIQIQDVVSTNSSLLSSYASIFVSSSSTPTMASLLASSFHQQKLANGGAKSNQTHNSFHSLAPFQDLQIAGNNEAGGAVMKQVKVEDQGQSRMDWNNLACQNQIEQIGLSDPSLYNWSATSIGACYDPSSVGSSVPSLI